MRTKEELAGVTALGSGHTEYKSTYDPSGPGSFPQ